MKRGRMPGRQELGMTHMNATSLDNVIGISYPLGTG